MGMFARAIGTYRLAKLRQQELYQLIIAMGIKDPQHLDTKFLRGWVKEAMDTDAETVATKYRDLIRSAVAIFGPTVTRGTNEALLRSVEFKKKQDAAQVHIEREDA